MKTKGNKKQKVSVITLGCSKNVVDSEVIMGQLRANEFAVDHNKYEDESNIVIVNTCGFIDNAKEESINSILEFSEEKKKGNIDKLYVTGCLSERYANDLKVEVPIVDEWFGTLELPRLLNTLGADYKQELIGERLLSTPNHFAYIKISEGCSRTCAFCAIPLMRGKHISRPIEELVKEIQGLVRIGVKEVILIAQELTYYGLDIYKKRMLADLLKHISDIEGLEWIRLHYAYPSKFPVEILPIIADRSNICNYLDIPLQHASDPVLARMNRQITREETEELIFRIRTEIPNVALRTTMLIGFPGETADDHEQLKEFVQKQRLDRLGCFTYSHEEGTSGYLLKDDVPEDIKHERVNEIMEIQQDISYDLNQQKIGKIYKTLFDRKEGGQFIGRTEYDSPEVDNEVIVDATENYVRVGDFANVEITEASEFDLQGKVVPS